MTYVTSIKTRLLHSARGELFNPLIYPFFLVTFTYGLWFTVFSNTEPISGSLLFQAMTGIAPWVPAVWGSLAIAVILVGVYVLVFDKPPIGKANCFITWMLWLFASWLLIATASWLPLLAVAFPSLYFWTWQYFSLIKFRDEDILDRHTMALYDRGQYDDKLHPRDSRRARENNRGVDEADRDIRS